jgi:hypothetical protein
MHIYTYICIHIDIYSRTCSLVSHKSLPPCPNASGLENATALSKVWCLNWNAKISVWRCYVLKIYMAGFPSALHFEIKVLCVCVCDFMCVCVRACACVCVCVLVMPSLSHTCHPITHFSPRYLNTRPKGVCRHIVSSDSWNRIWNVTKRNTSQIPGLHTASIRGLLSVCFIN